MNKEESRDVVKAIISFYPGMYKDYSKEQLELMTGVWSTAFKNVPAQIVKKAVLQFMSESESPYPPAIGQISAQIKRTFSELDAEQQWERLMYIVRNVCERLHRAPATYMDEIGQKIVNEDYIRRLKNSNTTSVDIEHGNFIKRYNTLKEEREREAIQTGNLMLIASENKLSQLGVHINEMQIEHKEQSDVRNG